MTVSDLITELSRFDLKLPVTLYINKRFVDPVVFEEHDEADGIHAVIISERSVEANSV